MVMHARNLTLPEEHDHYKGRGRLLKKTRLRLRLLELRVAAAGTELSRAVLRWSVV